MAYDWEEYSSDSGVADIPLLLSIRSQQLILSAMDSLRWRDNWLEADDPTWDDIDDAVGQAHYEIQETLTLPNQQQFGIFLRSVDLTLAASTFVPIPFTETSAPQFSDDNDWMVQPACTNFVFPEAGYYQCTVTANFANLAGSRTCLLRFDLDGVNAAQVNVNVVGTPSLTLSNIFHIGASATLQVHAFASAANALDNIFPMRLSIVRLFNSDY